MQSLHGTYRAELGRVSSNDGYRRLRNSLALAMKNITQFTLWRPKALLRCCHTYLVLMMRVRKANTASVALVLLNMVPEVTTDVYTAVSARIQFALRRYRRRDAR